ncbi:hypothetical protein A3A66_02065 [Microgenomates group bacterium RIFCSPLOWO2_01_FULL_46_13]|nr:MAG: hypothetical protein A2783_01835 [Microgenomates group bacterium RIFCSPHIGHO2_01_FULL_45_11]OGV94762.1 MAG: hypothetical protein A3A66_02065 [Microgenomates group bacterium RIFCSPLOWO2_01_FULL_46_13]
MQFDLTIPRKQVDEAYEHVLDEAAKESTVAGFRQGKAPRKLVEEKVGREKLIEATLQHVLPKAYGEAIREKNLKPLTSPKITPKKVANDGDWEFGVEIAEAPEVALGDYKGAIKSALAQGFIWVPGKDSQEKKPTDDEKLTKIFDALLSTVKLTLPELLLEEEVNRALSQLIDQTAKVGLTVDQYLASKNLSAEQLRNEYRKTAEERLKLEFILQEIADDLKITVTDKEVDSLIVKAESSEERKRFDNSHEREILTNFLKKRKVLDNLLSLAS